MSKEVMPLLKISNLHKILVRDEGLKLKAYKDTLGNWTIGIGRLIGRNLESLTISEDTAYQMCDEDIGKAVRGVVAIFGKDMVNSWTNARRAAMICLVFNLGEDGFREFKRTIKAISENRWEDAASHLKESLWARQVDPKQRPDEGRDDRIAYMIRTGRYHEEYNCDSDSSC